LRSARNIHTALLRTVLGAPVEFFDTTPVGRMLSRFSKDIQSVDDVLPQQFDMVVRILIILLLNFFVIGYITPTFFVVVSPLMVLYYYLQRIYKLAALQYKRLDSITRSPVFNHFSESLGGLITIRAYGVREHSEGQNATKVNTNTRCLWTQKMVERWLSVRLESIGNVVVAMAVGLALARSLSLARARAELAAAR
jgi:ATP-binding cassette subfamily C (CFTR/MRP) protein 1